MSKLSNYATKSDFKNATGADTLKFDKKFDLSNLKSNVDKLDIDKLKDVLTNLSNLKNLIDKLDVDKLVRVFQKYVYYAKIKTIEDKIPDIINSATNTTLNAKTNGVEDKIPTITNLATTIALTAVENNYLMLNI